MICSGTGWSRCTNCGGSGTVGCRPCGGHGAFTHVFRTHLAGTVTRTVEFDKDAPSGFRESCLALPSAVLAREAGKLQRVDHASAPAEATATIHLDVRHVGASMRVKDVGFVVDAIGGHLAIPLMPAFLDDLVDVGGLTKLRDKRTSRDPSSRLREATQATVTRDILALVGSGKTFDGGAFSNKWKGAVSATFATIVEDRLRHAYGRAGRSRVRGTWLVATLPIMLLMVLVNAYHLPLLGFDAVWPQVGAARQGAAVAGFSVAQAVVSAPIILIVWLLAGHRARASLRSGVGGLAKKRPGQGVWPWLGLLLAAASGMSATATRVEAAAMGLPYAPLPVWRADPPPVAGMHHAVRPPQRGDNLKP